MKMEASPASLDSSNQKRTNQRADPEAKDSNDEERVERSGTDDDDDSIVGGRLPFVRALFEMVSNPENANAVGWTADGTALVIRSATALSERVLPRYFTHNNLSSFVRQLNMYGFAKPPPTDGRWLRHAFCHRHFVRGRPELLVKIQRKRRGTVAAASPNKRQANEDRTREQPESTTIVRVSHANVDVQAELTKMREAHEDMLRRVQGLESRRVELERENKMMKEAFVELERVQGG